MFLGARSRARAIARLLIGHNALRGHLHVTGVAKDPMVLNIQDGLPHSGGDKGGLVLLGEILCFARTGLK